MFSLLFIFISYIAFVASQTNCVNLLNALDTFTVTNLLGGLVPTACTNPANTTTSDGVKFGPVQTSIPELSAVLAGGGGIAINGTLSLASNATLTTPLACVASNAFGLALLEGITSMTVVDAAAVVS